MSNVSIKTHSDNGKNKGISPLGMHLPYIDDFFDKFAERLPFMRPSLPSAELGDFNLNPKVDIMEDDKSYRLSAELPGLDLDSINLELSDGILTLSGEKRTEKEEDKEGNYHLMERRYGYFKRSFALPPSVQEEKIKADFKKGVLSVFMPKSEKAMQQQRKITING
ncbi:MAG: HSP20 family protein [Gammaproteobacteria bacterium]|jgi:HSP20 family protein